MKSEVDHMVKRREIGVVTGGGSGIGREVAIQLGQAGVEVLIFDVEGAKGIAVASEISALGGKAHALEVDISNEDQVNDAMTWVTENVGVATILCNAAAIQVYGRSEGFSFTQWKRVIDINLNGTFLMCKTLLPLLVRSNGAIVNIASLAGKIGLPYDAAYSASKGGVITMTKALAKEYADREVRINVIVPGAVDTPMLAQDIPQDINPKVLGVIPKSARPPAQPSEIAKLVLFLCKDAPVSMTGSVVAIDGAAG